MKHEWETGLVKMIGRTTANGNTKGLGQVRRRKPREGKICKHCKLVALPPISEKKAASWKPPVGVCS